MKFKHSSILLVLDKKGSTCKLNSEFRIPRIPESDWEFHHNLLHSTPSFF